MSKMRSVGDHSEGFKAFSCRVQVACLNLFMMSSSWFKASPGESFYMRNPDTLHSIVLVHNICLMQLLGTICMPLYIHIHFLQFTQTCFNYVDAFKLQTLKDTQKVGH